MDETLTLNQLFEELQKAGKTNGSDVPVGWLRAKDIEERLGWGKAKTLKVLHSLNDQGRLEAKRFCVPVLGGHLCPIVHYAIVDNKEDQSND